MKEWRVFKTVRWVGVVALAGGVAGMFAGCPHPDQTKKAGEQAVGLATIQVQTARRQSSLVFLGKWEGNSWTGGRVVVGTPHRFTNPQLLPVPPSPSTAPALSPPPPTTTRTAEYGLAVDKAAQAVEIELQEELVATTWKVYIQEEKTASLQGAQVEQLLGSPIATVDAGSILVPAPRQNGGGAGTGVYAVEGRHTVRGVWLELSVPATTTPGTYDVMVELTPTLGSKAGAAGGALRLRVTVADLLLPQEPAMLALATTSTQELAVLYPATFGKMQGRYLDREDPEHAAAVGQIDTLVRQAQEQGVALFIADLGPVLHLDNVGRVELDWDAYDRTLTPYMDGSAFGDHIGLPAWYSPLPPRRIADSPTQLRQYWQACVDHAARKNWKVPTVLSHPAWQVGGTGGGHETRLAANRAVEVFKTFVPETEKHVVGAAMLNACAPRGTRHDTAMSRHWVWIPDDHDPRVPPVGMLGGGGDTDAAIGGGSVRVWPWMCQARGARGVLWPHALGGMGNGTVGTAGAAGMGAGDDVPLWDLLNDSKATILAPTVRLAWLKAGLNDVAHFSILARRAPVTVTNDLMAAVVGRSGLACDSAAAVATGMGRGGMGQDEYLYAGWLAEARSWESLPGMIDKLIAANSPGAADVGGAGDDPLYLAARMFMAQAHRPLARAADWRFTLDPGREGSVLRASLGLRMENPQASGTTVVVDWQRTEESPTLGGDFELAAPPKPVLVPAVGVKMAQVDFQGHPSLWTDSARLTPLRIREQSGGVRLDLPILLPVQRMRPARNTIKLDGSTSAWPDETLNARGRDTAMHIALGYATKPDLLAGRVRTSAEAATARWTYDADFIYTLIDVPQGQLDDDRTSDWPVETAASSGAVGGGRRWWGTDGVQVQIAGGGAALRWEPQTQIYTIGIKPSGTVLVRMATLAGNAPPRWIEAPPTAGGLRYAVLPYGRGARGGKSGGYVVELAIPRKWFVSEHDMDPNLPVWRVNVLRHQGQTHESTSWSGPLLDDNELGLMGVLTGSSE